MRNKLPVRISGIRFGHSGSEFVIWHSSFVIPHFLLALLLLFVLGVQTVSAQPKGAPGNGAIPQSPHLQELVDRAAQQALEKFAPK